MASFSWPSSGSSSTGTVTSVALSVPSFLSVSGSPITTSGTLAVSLSETALPVANGGTGLTAPGASGNVLTSNGTSWVSSAPASSGFSYLSSNTSVYGGTFSTLSFTGANNTIVGVGAGAAITSGTDNTALGNGAGIYGTTVSKTTSIGSQAIAYGTGSIAVGYSCGAGGNGSVLVGWNTYDSNQQNNLLFGSVQSNQQGCLVFGASNGGSRYLATTAFQQICFGSPSAPLTDMYIGYGAVGNISPQGITIQPTPSAGGTANLTGGSFTLLAGNGTGSGGSGNIIFQTAPAAGSGTTANTYATVGLVDLNGAWTLGATSTTPKHTLNSLTATGSGTSTLGTSNSPGASTPAGWLSLTINGTTHYIPFF